MMRWCVWCCLFKVLCEVEAMELGGGVKVRLGLAASARLLVLWIQGLNSSICLCVPWFLCCSDDE